MDEKSNVQRSVEALNIMDDSLFQKMAEDLGFCEELISTILMQKVIVVCVTPQSSVKNLQGRSVVLDAFCILENGARCNVEVQKANDDNHEKRVRYNTSCITANITEPGTRFENVPDVIGIFISQFDMFQEGKTVYHIDRTIRETGKISDNGLWEIYVNTKIDDGTDIAKLMHIFKEQNMYDFAKFPKISKRKKYFLEEEGGKQEMCDIVENYAKEYAREKEKETTRKLFENGATFELVRAAIDSLSSEELKTIYDEVQKQENSI